MKAEAILTHIIFIVITFQPLNGQKKCCCNYIDKNSLETYLSGEIFTPDLPIDPTTYFNQEWLSGDMFLSTGEIARNRLLKYNKLLDELFWMEPKSGKTIKLDKEAILKFRFLNFRGDTSVWFRKLKVKRDILSDSSEVFVQEIYHGKLSLFVLHTFYVERKEIVAKNNVYFEKEIYVEKPGYFLSFTNNRTFALKSLTLKSLSESLPDRKEQIKQFFMQARKVKIEIYGDMIMLMKYLNSIVDQ